MGHSGGLDGCGKSRPHRDSIPDRPVGSSDAIPTELPDPHIGLGTAGRQSVSRCVNSPREGSIWSGSSPQGVCKLTHRPMGGPATTSNSARHGLNL